MILVYGFVEEDLRPLVLNVVSIGWQIFYLMLLRDKPQLGKGHDNEPESVPDVELGLVDEIKTVSSARNHIISKKTSEFSVGGTTKDEQPLSLESFAEGVSNLDTDNESATLLKLLPESASASPSRRIEASRLSLVGRPETRKTGSEQGRYSVDSI